MKQHNRTNLAKTSIIVLIAFGFMAINTGFTKKSFQEGEETITWYGFQEGYDKAVAEKKRIYIDMYTDWCGYCKKMDAKTFSNSEVITKMNTHFIAIKFNPEKEASYMVNNKVMSAVELKLWLGGGKSYGYPSNYFWLKPYENTTIKVEVGYYPAEPFSQILDYYIQD